MGQTAENVAEFEDVTGVKWTSSRCSHRHRAVANQENGFFEREIIPVTLADGTVVAKDDGPTGTTLEGLANSSRSFAEGGTVTAGNACPLNDERSRGHRHERCQGQATGASRPSPG